MRFAILTLLLLALAVPVAAQTGPAGGTLNRERAVMILDQLRLPETRDLKRAVELGGYAGNPADEARFRADLVTLYERKIATDLQLDTLKAGPAGGIQSAMAGYVQKLVELDTDSLDANANPKVDGRGNLFNDIASFPASYEATVALAAKFNPAANTNDSPRLSADIDAYLASIANNPCIRYALEATGTTMARLKANWFGQGRAFEHVFNGELKGNQVSGYHFWYKYYHDERTRATQTLQVFSPADPKLFCGKFTWDPDGAGNQFKPAMKNKGSFSVGASGPALLALGHLAMETARKNGNPSSFTFSGTIKGKATTWQVFTFADSLRSMFPLGGNGGGRDDEERRGNANELIVKDMVEPIRLH